MGVEISTQRLARPALVMAAGTALSRATGLGRLLAMAFALGVAESRLADAYNLANTLPNILYELVLGGVLSSVFIPVVVQELRTRDREAAWRSISALFTVVAGVLLVVSVATVVLAPVIVAVFTGRVPGPDAAQQRDLATYLLRLFAPQIALYGLVALAEGLLNAHGRFALPTFVPILNNVVCIAVFVTFGLLLSGTPTTTSVVDDPGLRLLLGAGTTLGVAVMLVALWPSVHRLPGRRLLRFDPRDPAVGKLARLSSWTMLYVGVNAAGVTVSFYLAGGVQGGLTAYTIAFAFFQLPVGIAGISIVTALVPKLSAHHVDGDRAAFRDQLARGMEAIALVMLPATAALLVLAGPLVHALLEHGVVGARSADLVAGALRAFAVGLLPFAAFQLLTRAFYTRQDGRTPALINVGENAVTVALDVVLFPLMGIKGLALAHSLGYVAGCVLAAGALRSSLGRVLDRRALRQGGKAAACAALAGLTMSAACAAVAAILADGTGRALAQAGLGAAVGGPVFLAAARLLGLEGLDRLPRSLRPRRARLA